MRITNSITRFASLAVLLAALAACAGFGPAASGGPGTLAADFPGLPPGPQENFPHASPHSGG